MTAEPARGHSRHVTGAPRTPQRVFFSVEERRVVGVAADRAGLKPGAYIARAAVRSAKNDVAAPHAAGAAAGVGGVGLTGSQARELLDEVHQVRRLLGNVAGNLNDVARHANSTGEIAAQTGAVLDFVSRSTARVDAELMTLLRRLA